MPHFLVAAVLIAIVPYFVGLGVVRFAPERFGLYEVRHGPVMVWFAGLLALALVAAVYVVSTAEHGWS